MIFMLHRRPFTADETATIMRRVDRRDAHRSCPGHVAEGAYGDLSRGRKTMDQYVDEATVRAGPVFDDRPFFFARQKPLGTAPTP